MDKYGDPNSMDPATGQMIKQYAGDISVMAQEFAQSQRDLFKQEETAVKQEAKADDDFLVQYERLFKQMRSGFAAGDAGDEEAKKAVFRRIRGSQ
jgi:hypothetical protein